MIFHHDSRSEQYRFPMGAQPCGTKVRLRVYAQDLSAVTLRLWWEDAEERRFMDPVGSNVYEYELTLPENSGLLWYYFIATDAQGNVWYLGNANDDLGGEGRCMRCEPPSFQITVYEANYDTPEWMRDGLMMQIMVDRFANAGGVDVANLPKGCYYHPHWDDDPALVINDRRGELSANDFFGGNLRGIEEKLEYIKSMGVTALYFNPIFEANSNHKYNTGNYMKVDPSFGSEADLKRLCKAAKKVGIRIVIDGVFSHTGADSVYFDRYGNYGGHGAYTDAKSPYREWFIFNEWPDDYESWWGFKTLPNVREDTPSYMDFIINAPDSVIAHWMKAGIQGWRLDVADELPMDFIRALRKREKRINPESALIGEVWEDPTKKVAYDELRCYCTGDTLDATMNYPLRNAVLEFMLGRMSAHAFVHALESMRENQPKPFFYAQMNLLGSHDRPRAISVLADVGNMQPERKYLYPIELPKPSYEHGKRRLIAAWGLVCALPGMPCMYYGDEAGLYGMSDPYCRGTYPWGREDQELLEAIRAINLRRMNSQALRTGTLQLSAVGEDVVLIVREIRGGADVFGRPAEDEVRVTAVNRANSSRWMEFEGKAIELPPEAAVALR